MAQIHADTDALGMLRTSFGVNAPIKAESHGAGKTSADALTHNANALMNRANAGGEKTSLLSTATNDHNPLSPSSDANKNPVSPTGSEASKKYHADGTPRARPWVFGRKSRLHQVSKQIMTDAQDFEDFLKTSRRDMFQYLQTMIFLVMVPSLAVAALLYYGANNPPHGRGVTNVTATGVNETDFGALDDVFKKIDDPSISWWFIFLGARQPVTFTLARITQAFVIDFLCLRTNMALRFCGSFLTLLTVQAKGWPFLLLWWSFYNFFLLFGNRDFAHHWAYWQDVIDMFNENNQAGNVTESGIYKRCLCVAVILGVVVAIKRFWLGLWLGRRTYQRYAAQLTSTLKKSLLIGQVASLARDIERFYYKEQLKATREISNPDLLRNILASTTTNETDEAQMQMQSKSILDDLEASMKQQSERQSSTSTSARDAAPPAAQANGLLSPGRPEATEAEADNEDAGDANPDGAAFLGSNFTDSNRLKLEEVLGAFEEPEVIGLDERVSAAWRLTLAACSTSSLTLLLLSFSGGGQDFGYYSVSPGSVVFEHTLPIFGCVWGGRHS
jgi:hypothetical protein